MTEESLLAPSLDEVKAKFEQWRSTRTKKGKIPPKLWAEALALLNQHSIGRLTKNLGISSQQIKAKMKQPSIATQAKKVNGKSDRFVAINLPSTTEGSPHPFSVKIEIKRPDGATLVIDHLNSSLFTSILSRFMEKV